MYRDIPVFNRPIMEKIYKQNQEKHLQRLRNIKTSLNSKKIFNSFSICNKKTALLDETKKTEIEKQNILLFNKMMRIMKRADPNNTPFINNISHKPRSSIHFQRIQEENISLFQRLDQQKPTISNKKFQEQRGKNLTILKFLGKYPNPTAQKFYQRKRHLQSQKNKTSDYDLQEQLLEGQFQYYQKNQKQSQSKFEERRRFTSQNYQRKKKTEENRQSLTKTNFPQFTPINNNQNHQNHTIQLFSGMQNINNQMMHISIIRDYKSYQFLLTTQSNDKQKLTYSLKLSEDQGNSFFVKYDYNYKNIVKLLKIENGNLIIAQFSKKIVSKLGKQSERGNHKNQIIKSIQQQEIGMGQRWENYQEALQQSVQ